MDYKETLLLPQTDFPMRGNLPQNEPIRYAKWFSKQNDAYAKMIANRVDAKETFILHDGPPYANGHIHIGHALNKILKDIIIKTHYFAGEKVRYVPGWDCHGLPIEQQMERMLGKDKKDALPKSEIRELCREHARKFIDIQKEEFKSLGIMADWDNPYLTMKFQFEADIFRALCGVAHQGLLIERSKPVYWSWAARSALAEAEVEYENKEDYSIFVAFELSQDAQEKLGVSQKASVIIWTTTPWTLPANVGISFNPDENYVLTSDGYIVAEALYAKLFEQGVVKGNIAKTFKASIFENSFAINPLNGRPSRLLLGSHVTMDGGSGAVHTAPGHGEDDYKIGLKYGLEIVMPVDERGCYDDTVVRMGLLPDAQSFVGEHIFKANERILELLGTSLLQCSKFTHSYPFCWRTHQPVIYRATKQWFIAMDEATKGRPTLRNMAMDALQNVRFYPRAGMNRLGSMIEGRPDWCISRQRDWGVPIAFFRDKGTNKPVFDAPVVEYVAKIFEQKGADAWWDLEIKDLLVPNSGYEPDQLEKVMDILDVWFDSGSTWKAVLQSPAYDSGDYPASLYLEGSDQHRGWFQSSLLVSTANNGIAPYQKILTHGFTVDEKGEKMSKHKGNVVAPNDIAKTHGVEILRLWVGTSEYTTDLKISDNILKQIGEQYRKIRNTFRFLLANVNDLDTLLPYDQMQTIDQWILVHAKGVFDEVEGYFREYEFSKGFALLNHFIAVELSGIYLDISKDRLYCNGKNDVLRLSSQSAMALIAQKLMALMAPTLTYTIDEMMEYAPDVIKQGAKDVFDLLYTPLQAGNVDFDEAYMMGAREKFFEIVDGLKKEKVIKSTLELVLQTTSSRIAALPKSDAEDWFTVSKVITHEESSELGTFSIEGDTFKILKAAKCKCPRCWKYRSKSEEVLCHRCSEALHG